jgi:putative FmdB family regulatory protein
MPLYEYQCDACGARFELIRKFSDPPVDACAACGAGPVRKLVSSPAFQFKGSGWYVTDYAKKGESAPVKAGEPKAETGAAAKPEAAKADSAPAAEKPAPAASPAPPGKDA